MNERIQKLWDEAADSIASIPNGRNNFWETQENFMEKFAELIIRECCSKLVEMGESWHEFARNPPQGQAHNASGALFAAYRLKEDAVDEIREHFGVEL